MEFMSAAIIRFEDFHLKEVRDIFFESSSRKTFTSKEEKERFFHKYLGYYLLHWKSLSWVAVLDGKVLGYIVASPETNILDLMTIQPHLDIFLDEFTGFPAHLHINCHINSRGRGIGEKLVHTLEQELKKMGIRGVHIITSEDSPNRRFYQKLLFSTEIVKEFQGHKLLFMGKNL